MNENLKTITLSFLILYLCIGIFNETIRPNEYQCVRIERVNQGDANGK